MIIFKSIKVLNKNVNFNEKIGFVPTMGALHEGHISLIKASKAKCKKTMVSIFINKPQFNKRMDFKNYPKNRSKDYKILKSLKVDYLLVPNEKDIYSSKKQKKIKINQKDKIMCAKFRSGHFEGVLAVINQFLLKLKPSVIFLGEKDFQQVYLIKKFVKNKFKTKVVQCKTIRDINGLPYSSRNILLNKNNLKIASDVSRLTKKFYRLLKLNLKNSKNIKWIKKKIKNKNVTIEYIEIRNKLNLSKKITKKNFKIFVAYYIDKVRLIDNF